jgi:hypothetical protein
MKAAWLIFFAVAILTEVQAGDGAVFGGKKASEAALMGVLYDLKQTQQGAPTGVDASGYVDVLDEFVTMGFDEDVLNRFYRVSRPRYATEIFIPLINADVAPKAFGVDRFVKPSRWVIHYKGQVAPPEDGVYRFWGYADDMLLAGVNGKLVLEGSRGDCRVKSMNFKPSENGGLSGANDSLRAGHWMQLKASEPVDLDILIGERPGGGFCAFLLVEKQGQVYEKKGQYPIVPIFQVAPHDTEVTGEAPPFAKGFPPWRCLQ